MLAQAVVQIMADAPLFALGGFQKLLFQTPALLHFPGQCRRSLAHAFIQFLVIFKKSHDDKVKNKNDDGIPKRN